MSKRVIAGSMIEEEASFELSLRPRALAEYIGQKNVKDNLEVSIAAARKRNEPLDHILLYGPPGLGKTTLASVIANEMAAHFRATAGPLIQLKGDLTAILTNLEFGDVLFIDEIHRLQPNIEEILYPAMEDFKLDIIIGQGPSARTHRLDLRRFTLIGATTRAGEITASIALDGLKLLNVDEHGFDEIDRKLLLAVIERFGGGPVGVNTIAAVLSEEVDAIEDMYEPYLLQIGFLQRTPRGRVATQLAYEHLGIPFRPATNPGLF